MEYQARLNFSAGGERFHRGEIVTIHDPSSWQSFIDRGWLTPWSDPKLAHRPPYQEVTDPEQASATASTEEASTAPVGVIASVEDEAGTTEESG